jgi:hypothetical protein
MSKTYLEIRAICDSVGGCWKVEITCTRYDGTGNSSIRNQTFWNITTEDPYIHGFSVQDNAHIDTASAIRDAVVEYWENKKIHDEINTQSGGATVYPNSTDCSNDCEAK